MANIQKFEIEVEYRAGDDDYSEEEFDDLINTWTDGYDMKVHSVKLVGSRPAPPEED